MITNAYLILTVCIQTAMLAISLPFILQCVYISVTISIILPFVHLMSLGVLVYVVVSILVCILILIHNI